MESLGKFSVSNVVDSAPSGSLGVVLVPNGGSYWLLHHLLVAVEARVATSRSSAKATITGLSRPQLKVYGCIVAIMDCCSLSQKVSIALSAG